MNNKRRAKIRENVSEIKTKDCVKKAADNSYGVRNVRCSYKVAPSAARSSVRSVIASPLDWNVSAEKGTPPAD